MSAPQLPSLPVVNRLRSLSSRRRARDADRALDAEAATVTKVVLSGVQLTVPRGRLLGVAGAVGSGKTSLVTGITGQVGTTGWQMLLRGSCCETSLMVVTRQCIYSFAEY